MENDGLVSRLLVELFMTKGLNWMGLCNEHLVENTMHCAHWKDQEPGKDLVLDHIILDLTGDSVPLEHIADASVQRAFRRKKRLLRRSNTVLSSRLAIMALVAIMLVVTTLLTWYFTSTYSARSVKSLASVLRQQYLRTSLQAMASVLGEVYNATRALSSLHQQVYFATSNRTWESVELELRQGNRGIFKAQHQYSSVAFVSKDGRVTDYSRSQDREYLFFINATYAQAQVWYFQNMTGIINETDAPLPVLRKNPPYPLSAANVLANKPQDVYFTVAPNLMGQPTVSPAVPVKDVLTDTFLGLATITTTFEYLNHYLSTIDLLDGFLYFDWHNGVGKSSIVAFSYNDTNDVLASPQNASNPVVKAAATFLANAYGYDSMAQEQTHSDNVELAGQKYYIDTMPVAQKPYSELNLTAVMIVPRKSIMGKIDRRNRTVVGVSVGTAIGVLVLGCCFICFVTSKMSTEMQLRQELIRQLVGKHRAEQSSNYKSQFLANMSHEMRTPMAGIIGLLDLLSCDALTPEQEISVSQIRRCAKGLLDLVNNVLDISKVEAGRMELDVAPFSVADELESLVDMFAAQSVGSSIDVTLDLSDNIPPVVRGDSTRIRQIFSNLLSNSVKFTTHGHVLIRGWVDQSLLEPEGKHSDFSVSKLSRRDKASSGPLFVGFENKVALVFEVDDSGCGIPMELHEMVFDSFVQGDSSTTRMHGGSGLGLYIVRSLVELMGGEVVVAPKQGPGTLMRFHIIVEKGNDQMFGRPVSGEAQALSSPSPDGLNSLLGSPSNLLEAVKVPLPEVLERTQVLVAMQESVARNVAVQWLERIGLRVTCVEVWEDITPTLQDMCKSMPAEFKSIKDDRSDDLGHDGRDTHCSPSHVRSPDSSSQASESFVDSVTFPSVLALVDVTMHPGTKVGSHSKFAEPRNVGSREKLLSRSDPEELPPHMQDILDYMIKLHSQHSIAVGWVVAPDCRARWKQALQADSCFLVMNKPLHGRRMKRLLALLSRTGKLEQHHWEVHSYQSSSPSTPRLRTMGTPFFSDVDNKISCSTDLRDPSGPNSWTPSDRSIFTVPPLPDEDVACQMTQSVSKHCNEDGSKVFLTSSQQHSTRMSPGKNARGMVLNHSEETTRESCGEGIPFVANSCQNSRKVGFDAQCSIYSQAMALKMMSSANVPTKEVPRFQGVLLVDIPYGLEENHGLLSTSTPQSPTSGLITPEWTTSGLITPEGENTTVDGFQEVRMDGVQVREFEEEWSGPVIDLSLHSKIKQRQRSVSKGPTSLSDKIGAQSAGPDPGTIHSVNSGSGLGPKALSSMHILLVEDTAVLQRLASMMLKKLGANVTVVGDGLQAVTAVAEASQGVPAKGDNQFHIIPHFDLILMDCAMPVMDGYNATKAIRAAEEHTGRHIPIVALTAHALASDEERCLSVGMDAYLTKPINCKLMVTTIQGLVSRGRL